MRTITLDVPDDLADELAPIHDRLPELLALSLQQPAVPAQIYREILTFLVSNPTPADIAAFGATPGMQQRLQTLLERSLTDSLTRSEQDELDELDRIEHLVIMLKAGVLPSPTRTG